jgi:hypothetical protein
MVSYEEWKAGQRPFFFFLKYYYYSISTANLNTLAPQDLGYLYTSLVSTFVDFH